MSVEHDLPLFLMNCDVAATDTVDTVTAVSWIAADTHVIVWPGKLHSSCDCRAGFRVTVDIAFGSASLRLQPN